MIQDKNIFFANQMGFFDKLKNFGSKIVRGIRKGWDFARDKVMPVVRKLWNPVKEHVAPLIPGVRPAMDLAENVYNKAKGIIGGG